MSDKIALDLEQVFKFIRLSLEMSKYENAKGLLEDLIAAYKKINKD